jgi:hypothetical protein
MYVVIYTSARKEDGLRQFCIQKKRLYVTFLEITFFHFHFLCIKNLMREAQDYGILVGIGSCQPPTHSVNKHSGTTFPPSLFVFFLSV